MYEWTTSPLDVTEPARTFERNRVAGFSRALLSMMRLTIHLVRCQFEKVAIIGAQTLTVCMALGVLGGMATEVVAQPTSSALRRENAVQGEGVPREAREIYERGLDWLAANQAEDGSWPAQSNPGPGVTGLSVMAFLAYGEDPNHGAHESQVQRGVRYMIQSQDPVTGYLGGSMYHHGFGTLALAEAYGSVDERALWEGIEVDSERKRSVGEALELAVRTSITSQNRSQTGGWRYAPTSTDADTSVSGAILVSLLAARNAGIEVPDQNIERAITYFTSMTAKSGQVAYAGGLGGYDESQARVSIATLIYSISGRKELGEFQACASFLKSNSTIKLSEPYGEYTAYYKAQALFQADTTAWEKWNLQLIQELKQSQKSDGSFNGSFGPNVATSLSLLSLALNFRFLPIYER